MIKKLFNRVLNIVLFLLALPFIVFSGVVCSILALSLLTVAVILTCSPTYDKRIKKCICKTFGEDIYE